MLHLTMQVTEAALRKWVLLLTNNALTLCVRYCARHWWGASQTWVCDLGIGGRWSSKWCWWGQVRKGIVGQVRGPLEHSSPHSWFSDLMPLTVRWLHRQEATIDLQNDWAEGRKAWCLVLLLPFINYMTSGICLFFLSTGMKHLLKSFIRLL